MSARDTGEAPHTHHWRIGEQDGPTSNGVCDCGAERPFPNTLSMASRVDPPPRQQRGGRFR